ncbi:MAG TPA: hypothetical protein VLV49_10480 [Terriglobales bacterium]|nr:hypothetical protein [Terriglobales bacterium]
MRIKRRLPVLLGVVLVAAAVAVVVVLRKHAPPEPARLLPGADGFVYVNLKWIRRVNLIGQLPPVPHDPEYQQFIEQTGFQWESDLDQAALAIHYPSSLPAPAPGASPETRYSEVLVGRIQGDRLRNYLQKLSKSVESYHAHDIYSIPLEGRTLRVVVLGPDTVAASNHPDPQVIQGIVDRSRKLASPFGGPALLRQYYKHVPLASLAWTIFRVEQPSTTAPPGPFGLSFLFSQPSVVVLSGRYLGKVHLRAEAYTPSADEAQHVTRQLGTFLDLLHGAESSVTPHGGDPDVKAFFASLKVEQADDRAVLTAIMPPGFLHKVMAGPPTPAAPPAAATPSK